MVILRCQRVMICGGQVMLRCPMLCGHNFADRLPHVMLDIA
jgi:hypothetical protein